MLALKEAYKILFGAEPDEGLEGWRLIQKIMANFDVRKLGEALAWECCYLACQQVIYPSGYLKTLIVGQAEGFASELCPYLSEEPHMDDIAEQERRRCAGEDIFNWHR